MRLVADLIRGRTKNHLQHDTALRYAILHALMIIAEAIRHLPPAILAPYPTIPWKDIVGIGTIIKHEYHRVDPDVIWATRSRSISRFCAPSSRKCWQTQTSRRQLTDRHHEPANTCRNVVARWSLGLVARCARLR
jgi:uncharacterized protein with HEPN domain